MKYEILFSSRFKKSFSRLQDEEKKTFYEKLSLFIENHKHPSFRSSSHKQLFIYSIDVLEKYQGKGYGKRLLNDFLKPFHNYECDEAFVFYTRK